MRSTYEDQPSHLVQVTPTDSTPMIAGGGTLLIGVLIFLAKWGFTQLSNDLKDKISGLQHSIDKLNEAQQHFSIEYVRKVEFDHATLKLEAQTEKLVSRLETKFDKVSDRIEQLLIKERGN